MKRVLLTLLICILSISLCACRGTVENVIIKPYTSEIYEDKEIHSAINAILLYFSLNFAGCSLTSITYGGDELTLQNEEYARRYNADDVIVLLSSFDVDPSAENTSLEPGSTYDGWNWILVRNEYGFWRHVDHGY